MTEKRTATSGRIVEMAIADLVPDPDNPMAHSDAEMQRLAGSVAEYGFLQPVVWNKRTRHIVSGHARVEAARATGLTTLSVVVVDFSEKREAAANLALNGDYGHWDDSALKRVLEELQGAEFSLDLTGLEPLRIATLFDESDVTAPSDFPAYGDDISTDYCCPKCKYEWSGKPK